MTYTLGASYAPIWMNCTGSPRMSAATPRYAESDDTSRNLGLDLHYIAEQVVLSNGGRAPREWVGQVAPNGTLITLDHALHVATYARDVTDIAQHCSEPLHVEHRCDLSWLAPGVVAIVDAAAYDRTSRHLTVWDAKFGHNPRDPFRDWQMILNGLAMCYEYPEAQRIDLRIVQPLCWQDPETKSWELDVDELKRFGLQARNGANNAQSGGQLTPGMHCTKCRGRVDCPAFRSYYERVGDMVQRDINIAPEHRTPQEISLELDAISAQLKLGKARKEALDAKAYHMAENGGVSVPGYKLVQSRSQRKIADEPTFVETARQFGYSDALLFHEPKLLSPAQLENVGVNKELVEMFTEKPDKGKQLVPMSDTRPAQASRLVEAFSKVSGGSVGNK